jgi:hypothetical protein
METIDDETSAAAADFIERQVRARKPFFCWMNTTRMHLRTHVRAEHRDKPGLTTRTEYADGMIEHDGTVGALLKKLDDLGIAGNTIVIYTTDNGPHMNSWPDGAMTPFRSGDCKIPGDLQGVSPEPAGGDVHHRPGDGKAAPEPRRLRFGPLRRSADLLARREGYSPSGLTDIDQPTSARVTGTPKARCPLRADSGRVSAGAVHERSQCLEENRRHLKDCASILPQTAGSVAAHRLGLHHRQ